MMRPISLYLAALVVAMIVVSSTEAFVIQTSPGGNRQPCCILSSSSLSSSSSSLLLWMGTAQPEIQIKTKTTVETKTRQKVEIKKQFRTDDPIQNRDEDFQEAPMYKLMLLDDDSHDQEHVVTRLCAILEEMDEDQAKKIFQQAVKIGKAMCGKYPFERAEMFKEQLIRSDPMIFSDLEGEND